MTEATANLPAVRIGSMADKESYAQTLASSALLPRQYQRQPANLLFAIEYAEMLQLPPMAAITGIHVIEGKPSASAALISALVRRAGHRLRVKGNDTKAVAQIIRSDDPDFTFEVEWTIERAKTAGLTNKAVWKNYPAAMLKARAVSEVAREACEEALLGMQYTPEELGANVDEDGDVVVEQVDTRPEHRPGMSLREAAGQTSDPVDVQDAEIIPDPDLITDAQIKKLAVGMKAAGITERRDALDYVMSIVGRNVASRKELTKDEASKVIDALDALLQAEADEVLEVEVVDEAPVAPAEQGSFDDDAWKSGGVA